MKYMGSKRAMLLNGLGKVLSQEVRTANRFVDLFAGSGAVSTFIGSTSPVSVLAFDLQAYSVVLTEAVIGRDKPFDWDGCWNRWLERARDRYQPSAPSLDRKLSKAAVLRMRAWCEDIERSPITRSYGGHYFSPQQSAWIDALRATLPSKKPARTVALAALIRAASQCAAAPGHTAQPFQPTLGAIQYLEEAWRRDVVERTRLALGTIASNFARTIGSSHLADANEISRTLKCGDLAFIDPPYSGVQYSRFYHVLESIAQGETGAVSGVGRYPAEHLRPRSRYSMQGEARGALSELLNNLSMSQVRAVLTFPDHTCSNGLSGNLVREIANENYEVTEHIVSSKFSTLGGPTGDNLTGEGRAARRQAKEMVLILNPRRKARGTAHTSGIANE